LTSNLGQGETSDRHDEATRPIATRVALKIIEHFGSNLQKLCRHLAKNQGKAVWRLGRLGVAAVLNALPFLPFDVATDLATWLEHLVAIPLVSVCSRGRRRLCCSS
jgi:hypothetical protein